MTHDPSSGGRPGWPGAQAHPGYGQQPGYGASASYPQATQQPPQYGQSAPWAQPAAPSAHGSSGWSGAGGYPAGYGAAGGPGRGRAGFVAAMTDFEFNSFATPVVIKVLYILNIVLCGLGLLWVILSAVYAFQLNSPGFGLFILTAGIVGVLVTLIYTRVILELIFAGVRIAEDVRTLRDRSPQS